jgi:hypothetical protein
MWLATAAILLPVIGVFGFGRVYSSLSEEFEAAAPVFVLDSIVSERPIYSGNGDNLGEAIGRPDAETIAITDVKVLILHLPILARVYFELEVDDEPMWAEFDVWGQTDGSDPYVRLLHSKEGRFPDRLW